jgi:hypothetical protein
MTPRFVRLGAVAALGIAVAVGYFAFRSNAIDLGPAEWFVVSPSGRVLGVGRPDGSLGIVDLAGANVGMLTTGARADALVFDRDDNAYVVAGATSGTQRYVVRQPRGATAVLRTDVDVPEGRRLVPVVAGARERGGLERGARRMLLAVRTAERIEALKWLELETLATTDVPFTLSDEVARGVTAMPGEQGFALLCVPAASAAQRVPARLRVFDAQGAQNHVIDDVAPVLPYWLPETGTLLFERGVGGISRFHPPDGKSVWVCDGRFTDAVDRCYVAERDLNEAWVMVEKTDGDGYVQVAQIWPFESGARRTRNLTTGLVHKFGVAVSFDHRFIAFRQVDGTLGDGPVDERVVLVDQSASYRSSKVVQRNVDPRAPDIGPEFPATEDVVLFVDRGRLWKFAAE